MEYISTSYTQYAETVRLPVLFPTIVNIHNKNPMQDNLYYDNYQNYSKIA
jgi:hypothetical protein